MVTEPIDFDKIEIGETFGPLEYMVSEESVIRYAESVVDHNPWYTQKSPFGGRIASPAMGAGDAIRLLWSKYSPLPSSVHAKHECEFVNPAKVGKLLVARGKLRDKYIKRDRQFVVIESTTTDEDGLEIVHNVAVVAL